QVTDPSPDPEHTLLTYLRDKLFLCGTKLGCAEGGCGACTVMLSRMDRNANKVRHLAINACLTPVCAMHGCAVTTVEGIGSTRTKLHPVQERLAKAHGSQCGFCTPGIVMSMYTLLRNSPKPSVRALDTSLQGNLCRCTGYRPIMEGYITFTKEFACGMGNQCCRATGRDCAENAHLSEGEKLFQRSQFQPLDPSQEPIFPPELQLSCKYDCQKLVFRSDRVTWFRPTSLEKLLQLKVTYPEAKLVGGNTEVGVETKFKNFLYPHLIHTWQVRELYEITDSGRCIYFGAGVSLTAIDSVLRKMIGDLPETETRIFLCVVKMLHSFAGTQIRNVACLGGNIMTGSPISDMNPILCAMSALIDVASYANGKIQKRSVPMGEGFYTGYRKNVIQPQEVLLGIHVRKTTPDEHMVAFKQARRRDDDVAIVNSAVYVRFQENSSVVEKIAMAFGGMGATVMLAPRTCAMMVGQEWKPALVEQVVACLNAEIPLSMTAPGGMIGFRRTLTVSLFFKSFLYICRKLCKTGILPTDTVPPEEWSGASRFHTQILKSSQLFERVCCKQPSCDPIGRPRVHASAFKQATGEAIFTDDIPRMDGELYMGMVVSQKANAKITEINAGAALALEGVHDFFCHRDLTTHQNSYGFLSQDKPVFAVDEVKYVGQIVGVVVADNKMLAQRAARLVKIGYEELGPVIVTIEEAIEQGSFFPDFPQVLSKGNAEEALAKADQTSEGSSRTGAQEHFYLETQAVLAIPRDVDELEIFSSTQHPGAIQEQVSRVTSLPSNKIVCRAKRLGGGFGGKEAHAQFVAVPAAFVAHRMRRPVRCMLDRDEDFEITGKRHSFLGKYKVGFTKEGKIIACDVELYSNGGYTEELSPMIMHRAMHHFENCYHIPNVRVRGWVCKTNLPSNTAFRAFGGPQGMFTGEHMIRDVARHVCRDVVDIMRLNFYKPGDTTHYNQEIEAFTIERCLNECIEQSHYNEKKEEVDRHNRKNRWRKRGLSVVPVKYGICYKVPFLNQGGALIHVYADGFVLLAHGGVEMGQGLNTKMIQCAARALGICPELIHTSDMSTDKVPNASATAGSLGSDINGMAVLDACNKLNERLAPVKAALPNGTWQDWADKAYLDRISLSATGFHATPGIGYDPETNPNARTYSYFTNGVGITMVEVDCLTGDHQVLSTDIVMDVGSSLNPAIDIGQIEGAFMQGYGLFTMEEIIYNPVGMCMSKGPTFYKIPAFTDIPAEFNVSLLTGAPNPRVVYSSKAVGEPPLFIGSSAFFAIKEAIAAAREENGFNGHYPLRAPATAARIRMACQDKFTNLV
ncbi:hypothetical protein KR018_000235, partial [Drosophila ironensis]